MDLIAKLAPLRQRVIARIEEVLPPAEVAPQRLHAAMRHGAASPGKCVRACWVYSSGQATGIDASRLDRIACATELVHAYSLIHDDLPCMDDDDIRRGQPSCHKAFGEATALLTGNALLICAFNEVASDPDLSASEARSILDQFCQASGSCGMIGGQQLDMSVLDAPECTVEMLEQIYRLKTGCLIYASVMMPTTLIPPEDPRREALKQYAENVSLAFQVRDDLEDIEQDTDEERPTYPSLLGHAETCKLLAGLGEQALAALEGFGEEAELLRDLGTWVAVDPVQ